MGHVTSFPWPPRCAHVSSPMWENLMAAPGGWALGRGPGFPRDRTVWWRWGGPGSAAPRLGGGAAGDSGVPQKLPLFPSIPGLTWVPLSFPAEILLHPGGSVWPLGCPRGAALQWLSVPWEARDPLGGRSMCTPSLLCTPAILIVTSAATPVCLVPSLPQ